MKKVLLIAGEVSGDLHAAALVRAIHARSPEIEFWGIGGPELEAAGMDNRYSIRDMAVLGLAEVLRRYGFFRRVYRDMVCQLDRRRPDAVLLVDYPGFNLRFAAEAHRRGVKVIYYICPQVWAWHRSRIQVMARIVDRLMVIFPFEPAVFSGTGLKVDYVGHPLVDAIRVAKAAPLAPLPWNGEPRVALLPGSRAQEVARILPRMIGAARKVKEKYPTASFLVAAPNEEMAGLSRALLHRIKARVEGVEIVVGQTRQVLRQACAAMVASGTATIEAALLECPMIVVYRTAWLTYWLGRWLVTVDHLGMVNLVAGRTVCPEFIQHHAQPAAMASALEPLLTDTSDRRRMVMGLREVEKRLGEGGAAERSAQIVLEELGALPE